MRMRFLRGILVRFDKEQCQSQFEQWARKLKFDLECAAHEGHAHYVNTYVAAAWAAWQAAWQVAIEQASQPQDIPRQALQEIVAAYTAFGFMGAKEQADAMLKIAESAI